MMYDVTLFANGVCSGKMGPGAWCAILVYKSETREYWEPAEVTMRDRIELKATIEGLKQLRHPCNVKIVTNSKYVRKWGVLGEIPNSNKELWEEMNSMKRVHSISFVDASTNPYELNDKSLSIARSKCKLIEARNNNFEEL